MVADILRGAGVIAALVCVYLSQRYWFQLAWRLKKRVPHTGWRRALRFLWLAMLLGVVLPASGWLLGILPRGAKLPQLVGMWLFASLFAWLSIRAVRGAESAWHRFSRRFPQKRAESALAATQHVAPVPVPASEPENPSRRYFFQTATYFAGAVPFVGALYGFAAERLRFTVERVEVPMPDLPHALDGLRIAQLSDIHLSGYMTREQVRRAVDMANDLGAELAVVTGDFITGARDPLEECVEELARLRAPLGVWGCNGNHEIYAGCEDLAAELLGLAGIRVLRKDNAEIVWREQAVNLIGVDYQRTRQLNGRRALMLEGVEPLVRRDVPNILLSHNPNAFLRARELGIELTLAGHTHGGQVNVEILEQQINPARFMTDFIAGLYQQSSPLGVRTSLYVNRGLGTVGTPVRIGAPPEITLLTLRRA
jgi:predicted MPP superfamily phosphohydrolase